jgi:hypothetical protein
MALSYLVGSVTQGGADAFAEAEIATALQGIGNVAFRVRELVWQPGRGMNVNAAEMRMSLTRRSKAAMPNANDRDIIGAVFLQSDLLTSGLANYSRWIRQSFTEDDELLIVEDPLYLQVDSNATTLTQTVYLRIGYERVSISAVDRLTLLTQSLE